MMKSSAIKRLSACAVLLFSLQASVSAQSPVHVPDDAGQEMLIKNSIVAVNHGIITGNYTVLRDLATESFRQGNTAGNLAGVFDQYREKKIDFSPVLVNRPRMLRKPAINQETGEMKLIGFFETRPQAVLFSLTFQVVNGGWMINGITLELRPTESVLQALAKRDPPTQLAAGTRTVPVSSSRSVR